MSLPIAANIGVSFPYGVKYSNGVVHKGVDFSDGKEGHDVFSCLDGTVTHAAIGGGWGPAYGRHVIIKSTWNGKALWMLYGHLKTATVTVGQKVKAGQLIGTSGGKAGASYSGNSTGPHVHIQACTANVYTAYISPWPMINYSAKPVVADWSKPATFVLGATGPDVVRLGERLEVWAETLGLPKPYKVGPSSPYSETDVAAVKAFQKAQKWTGTGADGYPGVQTLAILATDPQPVEKHEITLATWNVKSPTLNGDWPTWVKRRAGQISMIDLINPTVFFGQEFGSPSNVAWYDPQMAAIGLTNVKAYAKGTGKWRVVYYDANVFTRVTAGLYTIKPTLNGDEKQMAECVLKRNGIPHYFGSFHLENENGVDKKTGRSADQIRVDQIKDCFRRMAEAAKTHGIAPENCFVAGDTNSRGLVAQWVKDNTDYVDAFTIADTPQREGTKSINNWKPLVAGAREDYIFVHQSLAIDTANQLDGHEISDHNPTIVTFKE